MLCSNCHKNMAVIFTKKIDGDKSSMEGLCYNCAKEKGINPLEVLAKQANLSTCDRDGGSTKAVCDCGGKGSYRSINNVVADEDRAKHFT